MNAEFSISLSRRLLAMGLALLLMPSVALAALKIDITQGNVEPLPIAVLDFAGDGTVGQDLAGVIVADLERSGLFRPVDREAFIEGNIGVNVRPRFGDWRVINALALVTAGRAAQRWPFAGRVPLMGCGGRRTNGRFAIFYDTGKLARIGHLVADAIYERLTGETGYFDTRIVYVSESGQKQSRQKTGDYGSGRVCAKRIDAWQCAGADAALQPDRARNYLSLFLSQQAARLFAQY